MNRSVWEAFVARLHRNVEAVGTEDDEAQFVASPLDLSIREAHGGYDVGVERELSTISELAGDLEASQRGN